MALRAEYTLHQSDLGDFLSETMWEEQNGSMLSVLSAFARLDIDPWEEAARLASMPREAAAASLAKLLARLPSSGGKQPDLPALSLRLVDSLPEHHLAGPVTQEQGQSSRKDGRRPMNLSLLFGLAVALAVLQTFWQVF